MNDKGIVVFFLIIDAMRSERIKKMDFPDWELSEGDKASE